MDKLVWGLFLVSQQQGGSSVLEVRGWRGCHGLGVRNYDWTMKVVNYIRKSVGGLVIPQQGDKRKQVLLSFIPYYFWVLETDECQFLPRPKC